MSGHRGNAVAFRRALAHGLVVSALLLVVALMLASCHARSTNASPTAARSIGNIQELGRTAECASNEYQIGRALGAGAGVSAAKKGRVLWTWAVPREDRSGGMPAAILGGPAVGMDGTVYIVAGGERVLLWAISGNGEPRWSMPVSDHSGSQSAVPLGICADGCPLVTIGGAVLRIDPSGAIADQTPAPEWKMLAMGRDETIYYGQEVRPQGGSGRVTGALTAATRSGRTLWAADLDSPVSDCVAAPEGGCYLATGAGVLALDARGNQRWQFTAPQGGGGGALAVAPDGTVYLAGGNIVYAITPKGEVRWSRSYESSSMGPGAALVDGAGSLYVRLEHQVFSAAPDRKLRWVTEFPDMARDGNQWTPPTQSPPTPLAMTTTGRLYACSPTTLYAIGD